MAAVTPVFTTSISLGNPTVAAFTVTPAMLAGNGHFLVMGGTFTVAGQKQYIDESFITMWRDIPGVEASAAKLASPLKYGINCPMDSTQLLAAGTVYNLEYLLNQTVTTGAVTNVYLELMVYP